MDSNLITGLVIMDIKNCGPLDWLTLSAKWDKITFILKMLTLLFYCDHIIKTNNWTQEIQLSYFMDDYA